MALVSDRCICLRKVAYSETSQILLLLARQHGLVRVIAKGAHRTTKAGSSKFGGGIDLLDLADAVFTHDPERELSTLTEWCLRNGHLELRSNLRGMYLAQYAAELVAMLIEEHDPHPDLFDRLEHTIKELATGRAEEAFLAFELDLLREAGYLAELVHCVSCGRDAAGSEATFFSPGGGGVVCRHCESAVHDRMHIDLRLVRLVQGIMKLPRTNGTAQRLPRLTRHQTDPLNRMFAEHVEHTLGRRLRLPRYVLGRDGG
ncbi:MAG TPA: DNA repair protein RecO [Tepidisphaeraceae bacterium]|nr:DNA repair protein RecO [Tepidisphaeraceae bacterium]